LQGLQIMNTKDASILAGKILTDFLKTGPTSPNHVETAMAEIVNIVHQIAESPKEATKDYAASCKAFLADVKRVKGMPTMEIVGDGANRKHLVSASGKHIAASFTRLLPKLTECYNACVENYRKQSQVFFDKQVGRIQDLVLSFLQQVPNGGTKDKTFRTNIVEIKKELRAVSNWSELFAILKQTSFTDEIEYLFVREGGAIAAIWHYRQFEEEGELQKTFDHQGRDRRVYAVRENWAIEKGLMQAGSDGYIEEITRPKQDAGCCCDFEYLYALRDLPDIMLTAKGKSELYRARRAVGELLGDGEDSASTKVESLSPSSDVSDEPRSGITSRLLRWLSGDR
jgi:hypothetical protein